MTKPKRKLVGKMQGSSRRPKGGAAVFGREQGPPSPEGIWIDGDRYPLQAQPPVAATGGWGVIPGRG